MFFFTVNKHQLLILSDNLNTIIHVADLLEHKLTINVLGVSAELETIPAAQAVYDVIENESKN